MTPQQLITSGQNKIAPADTHALTLAGEIANRYAAAGAFADYIGRKATNTRKRHAGDLARFADYLNAIGQGMGDDMARFADAVRLFPDGDLDGNIWRGVSWGLVEGFRNWMVEQGDAINSINARISAVKVYCKLAMKAGTIDKGDYQAIRAVEGYGHGEGKRIDERRDVTRRSEKKAAAVRITQEQAAALKRQPDTPQGRRDQLLMCLLLDHGLRAGEAARLRVSDFNLKTGEMRFYRPKVNTTQTHKLTADTARAAAAWFTAGNAPAVGPILRGSRKGGKLTGAGMSERAITERVKVLGKELGIEGLSAHDCRHFWATHWAGKVSDFQLMQAGGWTSTATVARYIEESRIANEGMA